MFFLYYFNKKFNDLISDKFEITLSKCNNNYIIITHYSIVIMYNNGYKPYNAIHYNYKFY